MLNCYIQCVTTTKLPLHEARPFEVFHFQFLRMRKKMAQSTARNFCSSYIKEVKKENSVPFHIQNFLVKLISQIHRNNNPHRLFFKGNWNFTNLVIYYNCYNYRLGFSLIWHTPCPISDHPNYRPSYLTGSQKNGKQSSLFFFLKDIFHLK